MAFLARYTARASASGRGRVLVNRLTRIGGSLARSQQALVVVATAHHGGVPKHGFK